jgi:hypothetical protein
MDNCKFCGKKTRKSESIDNSLYVSCYVCGKYIMRGRFKAIDFSPKLNEFGIDKTLFSGILRNRYERGIKKDINFQNELLTHNLKEIIEPEVIPKDPLEKMDHIILTMYDKIESGRFQIDFNNDINMFYCQESDFYHYRKILLDENLLGYDGDYSKLLPSFKGYERVREIEFRKKEEEKRKEEYFNEKEQKEIKLFLNTVKEKIFQEHNPSLDVMVEINSKFEYIKSALEKQSKIDWKNIAFSQLVSMGLGLGLDEFGKFGFMDFIKSLFSTKPDLLA